MLIAALIVNLIIIVCEIYTLVHIREKRDILKYYTYLQNFLALIVSVLFAVCLMANIVFGKSIPEYIKGLRYIATCGLTATMFIFVAFLGAGKKIAITEEDFLAGLRPERANILLHYICPMLSLFSLVVLEREIVLSDRIWTGLVAIPSCVYWTIYLILSATKMWKEPYNFTSGDGKNSVLDVLTVVMLPLSFVAISFVVWNVM